MKKLLPLALLLCALVASVVAVWLVGGLSMHGSDADPAVLMAGAVLSRLRDGERFSLADVYPEAWDTAQFAPSSEELSRMEQRALFDYDARYAADEPGPLLLLWRGATLVSAIPLPDRADGYPRFTDATGRRSFELFRADATFLCTFMPDEAGRGGYYECRPVGERV